MFFGVVGWFWILVRVVEVIVGIGLAVNSVSGLLSGEGMYDRGSAQWMTAAGWLGIAAGVVLFADGTGLIRLPVWDVLLPMGGSGGG